MNARDMKPADVAKYPYILFYVRNPNMPRTAEGNSDNQLTQVFRTSLGRIWFVLTNTEARKSLLAKRMQFVDAAAR